MKKLLLLVALLAFSCDTGHPPSVDNLRGDYTLLWLYAEDIYYHANEETNGRISSGQLSFGSSSCSGYVWLTKADVPLMLFELNLTGTYFLDGTMLTINTDQRVHDFFDVEFLGDELRMSYEASMAGGSTIIELSFVKDEGGN